MIFVTLTVVVSTRRAVLGISKWSLEFTQISMKKKSWIFILCKCGLPLAFWFPLNSTEVELQD